MTSRSTLPLLVVAALLGLSSASSFEDEFYRSVRAATSIDGLDDSMGSNEQQPHGQEPYHPGHPVPHRRDSWQKLAMNIKDQLEQFSSVSVLAENNLKDLCKKVERDLEVGHQEHHSLNYAKQQLNEQRAVIEALRSGVPVLAADNTRAPMFDEVMQKTDQFMQPSKGNEDQGTKDLTAEHEKLIASLKKLQNLKF